MTVAHNTFLDLLKPRQDRRAIALEKRLSSTTPTPEASLTSTSDPFSSGSSLKTALSNEPNILVGRIVQTIDYAKGYKVQLDRGGGIILCCELSNNSSEVMGARDLTTYLPNSMVLVACPRHLSHGIILGSIPDWMIAPSDAASDYIVQGSNVGSQVDTVHNFEFDLEDNGGIPDFSAGGAFDHISTGDWGSGSDTGGMCLLDSAMTFLRVDEETGLFLFYDNQRARLTGHNLQVRSGTHETSYDDDQSELTYFEGHTTGSNKERQGAFDETTTLFREIQPEDYQLVEPWYSRFEPAADDQQAIFRLRVFRGYLGQGDSRMLCTLPVGASGLQQYSKKEQFPGVAEDQWATDGTISIRSAKALIFAKRALLPQPKQMILPEDPLGDHVDGTTDNYRFRGTQSVLGLPNHAVGDIGDSGTLPSLVRAAAFRDFYALNEIHKQLLAFQYHIDWYQPDESDYPFSGSMAAGISDYAALAASQWLAPPTPIMLNVDARYNAGTPVKYYPTDSWLAFLEDGAVDLADGFGANVRAVDGSLILSCPGDIFLLPGRSLHAWAGWDVSIRANNCIDVAANQGDVRVKADNTVYIMGGNNACGGVLIESKCPEVAFDLDADDEVVGGIILRAKETAVVVYGQQIYMALSDGGDGAVDETRAITMQAGDGLIISQSRHFFRYLGKSAQDIWNAELTPVVNEYWVDNTLLTGPLRVTDDTYINGCLIVLENLNVGANCVAEDFEILVDFTGIDAAATDLTDRELYLENWASIAVLDATRLQDDTDVLLLEFFFRDSAQAKTSNFALFETKWQQEARVKGMAVVGWTENPVLGVDAFPGLTAHSYPPPGKTAWVDNADLYTENQTLFDITTNLMDDWGAAYEYPTPTYATPVSNVLDGNFLVIMNS